MKTNFLNNIYGTLFTPDETFSELKENTAVPQALVVVVFVSILNTILNINGSSGVILQGTKLLMAAVSGIISWLFFASFFELVASIFNKSGYMKSFLTLSGFALTPWIFLAPIQLFKTGDAVISLFGIILGLAVWLWSTVLLVVAVIKTYNLSLGRALVFLVVPFVAGFVAFNWFIGFFTTLGGILKV